MLLARRMMLENALYRKGSWAAGGLLITGHQAGVAHSCALLFSAHEWGTSEAGTRYSLAVARSWSAPFMRVVCV